MNVLTNLFFTLGFCFGHFAQSIPIVRKGNWIIKNNQTEIVLPANYSNITIFTKTGNAIFKQLGKYGIIDTTGKELIPSKYKAIQLLYSGNYRCFDSLKTNFLSIVNGTIIAVEQDLTWQKLDLWQENRFDSIYSYTHVLSQKTVIIPQHCSVMNRFDYLTFTDSNNFCIVYDNNGIKIAEGNCEIEYLNNSLGFIFENESFIITDEKRWDFPKGSRYNYVTNEHIHYNLKGKAHLLNFKTKELINSYICDKIMYYNDEYYEIEKNKLFGLMNRKNNLILDVKYESFYFSKNYIYTIKNGKQGLCDLTGKVIIPNEYYHFTIKDSLIYTETSAKKSGLISLKTSKTVLDAVYDRIEINKLNVKAYIFKSIILLKLNARHEIIDRVVLNNAITMEMPFQQNLGLVNKNHDPRLFTIGWFLDTVSIYNKKTQTRDLLQKWGIKNHSDSIILSPSQGLPKYVMNANFSMVNFQNLTGIFNSRYSFNSNFMNVTSGKIVKGINTEYFDTTDFKTKNFGRLLTQSFTGIIRSDCSLDTFSYLDLFQTSFVRVCKSKKKRIFLDEKTAFSVMNINPFDPTHRHAENPKISQSLEEKEVEFPDGKWNFLKNNGEYVSEKWFDFALPFENNRANVSINKKWGLLGTDSLVIPTIFDEITPLSQFHNTLYAVTVSNPHLEFLDTNLAIITDLTNKIETQTKNFTIYKTGKTFSFRDDQNQHLVSEIQNYKLHEFGIFTEKIKKDYIIRNVKGETIGSSELKPITFITPDLFACSIKGKTGLISVNGDTLIQFVATEIEKQGPFIIATIQNKKNVYSKEGKLILQITQGNLLIDTIQGLIANQVESKITIFEETGKKIQKLKSEFSMAVFHNGLLISANNRNIATLNVKSSLQLNDKSYSSYEIFQNGYIGFTNSNAALTLYDNVWNKVISDVPYKKITYIDLSYFWIKYKSESYVLNAETGEKHTNIYQIHGDFKFNNLLIQTTTQNFPFIYLNRQLQPSISEEFKQAKPFSGNFGIIKDENGWTIIDKHGIRKSYGSYQRIDAVGTCVFQTTDKYSKGIYDCNGKVIIPAIYEKITETNNGLFQVIKDGKIGYFSSTGEVVYWE